MTTTDEYEAYLRERVKWYTDWCLEYVAKIGYPGKIKFADKDYRYPLECYEEALEEYLKFRAKHDTPTTAVPDKPLSVTMAQGYISDIEDIPVARSLYDDDEGEGE